jgi:hypothetical protein
MKINLCPLKFAENARTALTHINSSGEDTTNRDLRAPLGYPDCLRGRLALLVAARTDMRWKNSGPTKWSTTTSSGEENANEWDGADKRLGEWRAAFTGETIRR